MATSIPTTSDMVDRLEIRELLENWVVWRHDASLRARADCCRDQRKALTP